MQGEQRVLAVVVVVVGLFTLPVRGGLTAFTHRVERATTGLETNIINGGGGGGGGEGGGSAGSCPEFCPFDNEPVCGSDGVTYTNPCTLSMASCRDNAALTAAYMGVCDVLSPTFSTAAPSSSGGAGGGAGATCREDCTKIFSPVCGSDGVTYTNKCQLELAACLLGGGITMVSESACATEGSPSQSLGGESGQGDLTSQLGGAGASGPDPETPSCSQQCTRIFLPVCGSDGVTYNNLCLLEVVDCERRAAGDPGVTVASEGACDHAGREDNTVSGSGGETTQVETTTCSKECTRIFLPVCGSDGVTYNNLCLLEIADCESRAAGAPGVSVASEGACGAATETPQTPSIPETPSCSQQCTRIFFPVCGSDGVTYNNLCLLEVADCESRAAGGPSVIVASEGACGATTEVPPVQSSPETPSCSQECTRIFLPVCGSDGVTYNNLCLLEIADCERRAAGGQGVSVASEGPCGAATEAPQTPSTTETSSCSQQCTRIFLPVCGSDGVTYNNLCLLEIADCESRAAGGPAVSVASEGACGAATETPQTPSTPETPSCSQQCTRIFLPVCGSDGVTYNNLCLLEVADCDSRAAGTQGVSVSSEGACGAATEAPQTPSTTETPSCSQQCTRIFLPVCGSDGVTYNNLCLLEIADCERRAAGAPGVSVASEGACGREEPVTPRSDELFVSCRRQCTRYAAPVCGSDGVTYDNECLMEDASCRARRDGGRSIFLRYGGPCDPSFDVHSSGCREECSTEYEPVCGSDGRTYDNECVLDASNCGRWARKEQGVYLVDEGPCEGDARTSPDIRPSLNMVLPFSHSSSSSPSVDTHQLSSPSLDSPSSQSFSSSPQQSSPSVDSPQQSSPSSDSPPSPPVCSEACTREFRPVCGSDGLTYNNPCALEVANCKSRARGGLPVEKDFEGPCVAALPQGPVCEASCDRRYRPVCGSDGETYSNVCLLQHADCLNPFFSITAVHEGPCQRFAPVDPGPSAGLPSLLPLLPEESRESSSEEDLPYSAYPLTL